MMAYMTKFVNSFPPGARFVSRCDSRGRRFVMVCLLHLFINEVNLTGPTQGDIAIRFASSSIIN